MKVAMSWIVALILVSGLEAFPRWSVREDASCNTCHLFQGGGAARNAYGKEFSQEELSRKSFTLPWVDPYSERAFSFGLDARYMLIQQSDRDLRHFPMQFALYGGAEVGSLIAHAEINRLQEEFRLTGGLRYQNLPLEGYIAIQRQMPSLGWRVDDHTLYSRGGNLTPQNYAREGMPFTPFLDPPIALEVGAAPILGVEVSGWVGEGFLQNEQLADQALFSGAKASYRYAGEWFTAQVGAGFIQESELNLTALSGGLSALGFVWLSDISLIENWSPDGARNMALMHQLSYAVFQGAEVVARYEFYDPDSDLLTGALSRYSLGVDLFLVSGLELKLSYRDAKLTGTKTETDIQPQLLSQIHLYF